MISIGEIIYRIQEHPLLKSVKKSDIVNHVKTVIELIGVPGLKKEVRVVLLVADYRVKLPEDFLERVASRAIVDSSAIKVNMTHNTDDFAVYNKKIAEEIESENITTLNETLFSHKIVNGYLYTDFVQGEVELIYRAYEVDENGWPMIPKNESVVLAIENYIKSRYFGILADMNANYERAYQRAEQQYTWYIAQATTSLINIDPVEAEALGSRLIRMIPISDSFYTNDKYSSQPERLNRQIW